MRTVALSYRPLSLQPLEDVRLAVYDLLAAYLLVPAAAVLRRVFGGAASAGLYLLDRYVWRAQAVQAVRTSMRAHEHVRTCAKLCSRAA
ncbi:hypothetical protein EON67_04150 [archaeon]|nr:MAG: hypothetical protein EON67_04150 [archaeon]